MAAKFDNENESRPHRSFKLALSAVAVLASCALFVAYAGNGGYTPMPQSSREPSPAHAGANHGEPAPAHAGANHKLATNASELGAYTPRCMQYCIERGCNKWVGCTKCAILSDEAPSPDKGSDQECCKVRSRRRDLPLRFCNGKS